MLIAAPLAQQLAAVLPPELVGRPRFSEDRVLNPEPGDYLRVDLCQGAVLRSPIKGVSARRWAYVATVAARERGEAALGEAATPEGFARLEVELDTSERAAECPDCADYVSQKGLRTHLARNTACRWRRVASPPTPDLVHTATGGIIEVDEVQHFTTALASAASGASSPLTTRPTGHIAGSEPSKGCTSGD